MSAYYFVLVTDGFSCNPATTWFTSTFTSTVKPLIFKQYPNVSRTLTFFSTFYVELQSNFSVNSLA